MNEFEKSKILRFLDAIEEGSVDLPTAHEIAARFDPLLTHFLLRYLREKFPVKSGASAVGPANRLTEMITTYDSLRKAAQVPKDEPMIEWFNDTHSMREFFNSRERFVEVIVDKLEG